jgi:hypothetical protein
MDSLVTTSWLAARLDDPGVVILDATLPPVGVTPPVDTHAHYVAKHIPGAIFFDIEALSDRPNPLPRPSERNMFIFSTADSAPGSKPVSPHTLDRFTVPQLSSTPNSTKTL